MRAELEQLVRATLAGGDDSAMVLKTLLDNCLRVVAASADEWEGQDAERTWPDFAVEGIAPELAFFLPTPAEFEEARRRLRLALTRDGRLNRQVLRVFHDLADHTVLVPLVDVLEGYDGDPSRYAEIAEAMNKLLLAAGNAAEADWLRAKRALQHVREISGDLTEQGYSLRYWADNALVGFGDDQAQQRMEDEHPLTEDRAKRAAEGRQRFEERFAAQTAEVAAALRYHRQARVASHPRCKCSNAGLLSWLANLRHGSDGFGHALRVGRSAYRRWRQQELPA